MNKPLKIPINPQDLGSSVRDMLPSSVDLEQFDKTGWFISDKIIKNEVLESAFDGITDFYNGKRDFDLPNTDRIADETFCNEATLLNNEMVCLQKKEIQRLCFHPTILTIAALLMHTNEVRYFADSLITKRPQK